MLTPHDFGVRFLYYDFLDFDSDGGVDIVYDGLFLLRDMGCS